MECFFFLWNVRLAATSKLVPIRDIFVGWVFFWKNECSTVLATKDKSGRESKYHISQDYFHSILLNNGLTFSAMLCDECMLAFSLYNATDKLREC